MKLLIDTNVIIDVLTEREPHFEASASLIDLVANGEVTGFLSATTVTTIFYLVSRHTNAERARECVAELLDSMSVVPVSEPVLRSALTMSRSGDFEDEVIIAAAKQASLDGIVTRDARGFDLSKVAVYQPREILALFEV